MQFVVVSRFQRHHFRLANNNQFAIVSFYDRVLAMGDSSLRFEDVEYYMAWTDKYLIIAEATCTWLYQVTCVNGELRRNRWRLMGDNWKAQTLLNDAVYFETHVRGHYIARLKLIPGATMELDSDGPVSWTRLLVGEQIAAPHKLALRVYTPTSAFYELVITGSPTQIIQVPGHQWSRAMSKYSLPPGQVTDIMAKDDDAWLFWQEPADFFYRLVKLVPEAEPSTIYGYCQHYIIRQGRNEEGNPIPGLRELVNVFTDKVIGRYQFREENDLMWFADDLTGLTWLAGIGPDRKFSFISRARLATTDTFYLDTHTISPLWHRLVAFDEPRSHTGVVELHVRGLPSGNPQLQAMVV